MADLAIGAVSLALSVAQGLLKYINAAKDAKTTVAQISGQMEKLATLLENLDQVLRGLPPTVSGDSAIKAIAFCIDAINNIGEKLGLDKNTSGSKLRQQMRSLGQRLAFPFKQDQIMFLQDTVESVERNLQTALLILQLEEQQIIKSQIAQLAQLTSLNYSAISAQQQYLQNTTLHRLGEQTQILQSVTSSQSQQIGLMQVGISRIESVAPGLAAFAGACPQLMSQMSRLENKLDQISLRDVTPQSLEQDISDFTNIAKSVKKINRSSRNFKPRCTCRGHSNTTVVVEWPIKLTKTRSHVHDVGCPYATIEEAVTTFQLGFTVCSISLRRKAQIGLALANGAGSSSVAPLLRCDRIVLKSSPGFRLLANFEKRLGSSPGLDAWEKPANELLRLFELRKASPHDRLPNGMTLLHYFCTQMRKFFLEDAETLVPNYYAMGKRILEFMPTQALEMDDEGRTCVDYFILGSHPDLVEHFLEYGISISLSLHTNSVQWNWSSLGLSCFPPPEESLNCSEQMKAMIFKSEPRLQGLLKRGQTTPDAQDTASSLYEMATRMRWRRGCEILLEHRVPITKMNKMDGTLLICAVQSKDEDTIKFWLEARKYLDEIALQHIGSLEEAVTEALVGVFATDRLSHLMVSALVEQREELRSLAIQNRIEIKEDRLPDAEAPFIVHELEVRGTDIKPWLRPTKRSIWYISPASWRIDAVNDLYEAGFRDVLAEGFEGGGSRDLSPLLYLVTHKSCLGPRTGLHSAISWYRDKGANLYENWPDTKVTLLHCFGYQLGNVIRRPISPHWKSEYSSYFLDHTTDGCDCPCSTAGCLFVTSFVKGLTTPRDLSLAWAPEDIEREWRYVRKSWRDNLDILAVLVDETRPRWLDRWLVAETIRLAVFTELDIRHTCCDLTRIQHSGNPDYEATPGPRYDPKELQRIREEDADLIELLEELVTKFTNMFDDCRDDIDYFLVYTFVEEMDRVLERLREDDRGRYGRGRREIGVVMDDPLGSDPEEDSDRLTEEDNSDNESFDESEL